MRYAQTALLLTIGIAAFAADAKMPENAPPRTAESVEYDRAREAWLRTVTDKLMADTDVDVAWAGAALRVRLLGSDDDDGDAPVLPPLPSSGVGRLLRAEYCEAVNRCPDAIAEWATSEPDNLAVLALANEHRDAGLAPLDVAQATHYDDYSLTLHALAAKVAARYRNDLTPPEKPRHYQHRGCVVIANDDRIEQQIAMTSFAFDEPLETLADDATLDPRLRLSLAELLIGAKGTPIAARHGATLGVAAADDPTDRERYCRLAERADAASDLDEAVLEDEALMRALAVALRTRNGIDAYAAIEAQLPDNQRAAPPDEAAIAACVARSDAEE